MRARTIRPGHRLRRRVAAALAVVLVQLPAGAAELFRYENEKGVVVLSSTLPPEVAARGYEVIDERGRVVRQVQRQLTPEEIRRREAEAAAAEAERLAVERRREKDRELLRLYGTPEDVTRALERRIASIEGAIRTLEGNIQRLRNQKRNLERRAADYERTGREIPDALIDNIRVIDGQIGERRQEIEQRRSEIVTTREEFARDRDRVRDLLGLTDDDGR